MKLPATLRVGPLLWTVRTDGDHLLDSNGNAGETHYATQTITIRSTMPDDKQRETLFHELCHAVDATFTTPELRVKERSLKPLAAGLVLVFLDNPALKEVLFPENASGRPEDGQNRASDPSDAP